MQRRSTDKRPPFWCLVGLGLAIFCQPSMRSCAQELPDFNGFPKVPDLFGSTSTSQSSRLTSQAQTEQKIATQANNLVPPPKPRATTFEVPFQNLAGGSNLRIQPESTSGSQDRRVSIFAQSVDLRVVLAQLAEASRVNIVVAENIEATVTTTLSNVPLWDALDAILKINGLIWTQREDIIFVTRPGSEGAAAAPTARSQPGQQLQVFDLHYTSSIEVLAVVNGLLSAGGKAFAHAVDQSNNRQTRERIVIEDFPDRVQAIAQYLASVDTPPRQVLIEVNVLQVTLDNDQRHGVNLLGLARMAGAEVTVQAQGFANPNSSPGFMMGLNGTDLDGMLETLRNCSTVETLAAPKILVVNGQQARIQVGSKFGYFVTTTTQTSTLQSVDFLDIGVVLEVTPTITHDGRILLSVAPKVSGGRINPDSGLPEEETTEADTTVLLPDGKGMIIGGLIKESSDHKRWWAPWLGEQPVIRKLFSRTADDTQRVEVIISMVPHLVPYTANIDAREYNEYSRATAVTAVEDNYPTTNLEFTRQPWTSANGLTRPNLNPSAGMSPGISPAKINPAPMTGGLGAKSRMLEASNASWFDSGQTQSVPAGYGSQPAFPRSSNPVQPAAAMRR